MNNRYIIGGVIVIVLIIVVAWLLRGTSPTTTTSTTVSPTLSPTASASVTSVPTTAAATATPSSTSSSASEASRSTVTIQSFAFTPASITVKKGTTVTWTNKDPMDHTVTADQSNSNAPDSGSIASGQSYSFTFNTPGTYTYHCQVHPYMTGTVIVTQ